MEIPLQNFENSILHGMKYDIGRMTYIQWSCDEFVDMSCLFKSTCLDIVGVNHWNKMYEKRIWGFHFLCIILSQKSNKVGVCKFLTQEVGKYSFCFFFYQWQYCPEGSLLMPERPLLLNKSRNLNGTISWTVLLCTEILLHHQRHLFIIIIIVINITMITIITISTTINVWV